MWLRRLSLRRIWLSKPISCEIQPHSPGPVVTCVGIGLRVFGRNEVNRSCGEVNDLIVWFLGEGVLSVDLAHDDLS